MNSRPWLAGVGEAISIHGSVVVVTSAGGFGAASL
jgi:hypothetical protein